MRFCDSCGNKFDHEGMLEVCKSCGIRRPFKPRTLEEALVSETNFRSGGTSAGSGITVNKYTVKDPTLPHVNSIKCPKAECPSNVGDKPSDVIYIKTDPAQLKFQYVCVNCNMQWTS
jgi:DNA-directed RNA polymerase subunit M/transcription elongation factor TFIIS